MMGIYEKFKQAPDSIHRYKTEEQGEEKAEETTQNSFLPR